MVAGKAVGWRGVEIKPSAEEVEFTKRFAATANLDLVQAFSLLRAYGKAQVQRPVRGRACLCVHPGFVCFVCRVLRIGVASGVFARAAPQPMPSVSPKFI